MCAAEIFQELKIFSAGVRCECPFALGVEWGRGFESTLAFVVSLLSCAKPRLYALLKFSHKLGDSG